MKKSELMFTGRLPPSQPVALVQVVAGRLSVVVDQARAQARVLVLHPVAKE